MTEQAVDISVVMPVWQPREDWLRDAVHSVLTQVDCDLELIVVDDGSAVPVADLLPDIDDDRVRHLRITHQGPAAARNAGIEVSRGAYLRFVDADDVLERGSTARLRAAANPTMISYEDTVVCDTDLAPRYTISSRVSGAAVIPCLLGEFDARHVSMLFPRDVVRAAEGWDARLRIGEDFDFVLRCLEHAELAPSDGTGAFYRRHGESATSTSNAFEEGQDAARRAVEGFFARHPELHATPVYRTVWRAIHVDGAERALALRRPVLAVRLSAPLYRLAPRAALRILLLATRTVAVLGLRSAARVTGLRRGQR